MLLLTLAEYGKLEPRQHAKHAAARRAARWCCIPAVCLSPQHALDAVCGEGRKCRVKRPPYTLCTRGEVVTRL